MTNLRKAAEQALEVMEIIIGSSKVDEAKETLRQALAQPEQEPVAYPEGDVVGPCVCGSWPGGKCLKCKRIESPKREWQGLTDEEIHEIVYGQMEGQHPAAGFRVANNIEAKLKEKNT